MADSSSIDEYASRYASGGSGSTSTPSRSSAPNLLFAIPLFLISLSLLSPLSRRFTRLRSAIGLGLCAALLAWAITVSRQGSTYLVGDSNSNNATPNDLAIWGITAALFLLAAITGATLLWPLGLAALAVASGFAFGLSILLLGSHGLIPSQGGRWGWLAVWAVIALALLAFIKVKHRQWVELAQSCITGAFLFSLSIDLLANGAEGASLGLRWILDTNTAHLAVLSYIPTLSTQLLMALSWIIAPIAAYGQYRLYRTPSSWPSHTWFERTMAEEDLNDEGTDQSPSSTISSTDDLDAEKAYLTSSNLSVKVSNVPGVLHKTPTRTTTAASGIPPAQTASIHPQQQQQQLRRPIPAGFPRSYSYPSSTSSSSSISSSNSNTTVYNMRNKRNSSAYPLPSLSQLMAYDDAQRIITSGENPGNTSHSSSATAVGNAWFTTPQPLPPNSRSNTRRNSAIPYTLPPSPLRAHEEDQNAEEQPRIDVSENAASTSEAEEILVRGSELPVIQVEDGEAILRDKVSSQDNMVSEEEQENQNQRQRKISGTNRSIRSNVSSTPTTMTAYESLPAEEVGDNSVATSTATAVHDHHHHQEEQPQSDLQILGQKSNISVSSSGDTLNKILSLPMQSGQGSSSSGTNITNEDFLISRNSSSSSLQTSISEISIPSKDERFDIANSNGCKSVTRILYQKEHDNDGVSKGIRNLYLETVILHSSMIYGTIHVRNIQVKSVLVRITKDNWQSFTDTQAKFTDQNNDKWTFNIEINENEHLASLQMALCAIDIDGREEWDSNNGENYHIRL